ncbi:MAG TPA: hypothetical protein VEN82_01020 [Actinomycetota bacterium]|nr:hypothetical protein [Actinomycetota bacterium]
MLESEAIQAALLAAAGEVQGLMNHLGLAARSAPTAKLVFETDFQASFRRALQFGRVETVSVGLALTGHGVLAQPCDVVVAGKGRTPQLAVELTWHPRGEDHAGFATRAMWDVLKMTVARSKGTVEQAAVVIAAPSRFWRWLPQFADDHPGYDLLGSSSDTPTSSKTEFLAGPTWNFLFEEGMDRELPERLWTCLMASADVRSPWADTEVRLLEVKGLGSGAAVRAG